MNPTTARRATSLVILGAFLALAVLAVLGNPVLGGLFIVVAGVVLGHHADALVSALLQPRVRVQSSVLAVGGTRT